MEAQSTYKAPKAKAGSSSVSLAASKPKAASEAEQSTNENFDKVPGSQKRKAPDFSATSTSSELDQPAKKRKVDAENPGNGDAMDEPATHNGNGDSKRSSKRKAANESNETTKNQIQDEDLLGEALRPLTEQDIRQWKGWCELESEPVSRTFLAR